MTHEYHQQEMAGWHLHGGAVIAVAAPAGSARRKLLAERLGEAAAAGAQTWLLDCDFDHGGPWAGVRELVQSLVHQAAGDSAGQQLLRRHDYELVRVLPTLRSSLGVTREGLTETAAGDERVRNYPADRAFRLTQGLADLFFELHAGADAAPAVLACDNFDRCGALAGHFFSTLARRAAGRMKLTLLVAGAAGSSPGMLAAFSDGLTRTALDATAAAAAEPIVDPAPDVAAASARAAAAEALEQRADAHPEEQELMLPDLIRGWLAAGRPQRALRWLVFGLATYNVMGLYDESLRYGERALALFKQGAVDDRRLHLRIVTKLFYSYLATKRAEEALRLYLTEAPREQQPPLQRSQICYGLAMVYARYLPQRDLARGEALLAEGLGHLAEAGLAPADHCFQYVFNRNGLAMIRQFQGRPAEALALCREGAAMLAQQLHPEAHRLHRSVLLYNIAQVHAAMGETEEAIARYTAVIEMDPYYSEYHNERANAYVRLGRFAEALADYERAIELSPPYPEVFINLGQCCRELGQMQRAIAAYSRALDLQPGHLLALLGRAQAHDSCGDDEEALADYSVALELDERIWEARMNRAVLYYGAGRLVDCLADLDRAVELVPDVAQLYQNRAIVLADLGRNPEAIADIEEYLRRNDTASDRDAMVERLAALAALARTA
jgi:tetratricopeptide (TPR) repeat protein